MGKTEWTLLKLEIGKLWTSPGLAELYFKTSEPEYFSSGLQHKIVLNASTVEIQLQKFFLISAVGHLFVIFVPRVRVIFCWSSDFPQFLCSTSACLNETTFTITNSSCGLAAGLNSIGFSENCRVVARNLLSKV